MKMLAVALVALALLGVSSAAAAQGSTTGDASAGVQRKPGSEGATSTAGASRPGNGGPSASTAPGPGTGQGAQARTWGPHTTAGTRGKLRRPPAASDTAPR
ncbi:hypothetical protein C0Z17_06435 [Trinickia caryophylli]|nr:hypothetical protein C0Z17_06435 [Trinickia caryophylli]